MSRKLRREPVAEDLQCKIIVDKDIYNRFNDFLNITSRKDKRNISPQEGMSILLQDYNERSYSAAADKQQFFNSSRLSNASELGDNSAGVCSGNVCPGNVSSNQYSEIHDGEVDAGPKKLHQQPSNDPEMDHSHTRSKSKVEELCTAARPTGAMWKQDNCIRTEVEDDTGNFEDEKLYPLNPSPIQPPGDRGMQDAHTLPKSAVIESCKPCSSTTAALDSMESSVQLSNQLDVKSTRSMEKPTRVEEDQPIDSVPISLFFKEPREAASEVPDESAAVYNCSVAVQTEAECEPHQCSPDQQFVCWVPKVECSNCGKIFYPEQERPETKKIERMEDISAGEFLIYPRRCPGSRWCCISCCFFRKEVYKHFAIVTQVDAASGQYWVVEYNKRKRKIMVRRSLKNFEPGSRLLKEIYKKGSCFDSESVVKRAEEARGHAEYHCLGENCEHLARFIKTGWSYSYQASDCTRKCCCKTQRFGSQKGKRRFKKIKYNVAKRKLKLQELEKSEDEESENEESETKELLT